MLEELKRWRSGRGHSIAVAVSLSRRGTAHGDRSYVKIDDRLPEPNAGSGWRFRITTRRQLLPKAHFDRAVRRKVNEASQERGRRIYAIDRESQEVMAVLNYHLDEVGSRPVLITALGTRCDSTGTPERG